MKVSVNLATRPFVELRPLYARLRLAMIALAVVALGMAVWLHTLNAQAASAQAKMDALTAKTSAFQQERQRNEARMHQPQNMAVLERSRFLNDVFARKSFSWTAVMMDLEKVLPGGIQVTSIEPQISKQGDVDIRLRVSGDRERGVELVRNLETSQRFLAPRLVNETAQTQESNGSRNPGVPQIAPGAVEFDILSRYNPLPPKAEKKQEEAEAKDKDQDAAKDGDAAIDDAVKAPVKKVPHAAPAAPSARKAGAR